jgi:hypothetical protein
MAAASELQLCGLRCINVRRIDSSDCRGLIGVRRSGDRLILQRGCGRGSGSGCAHGSRIRCCKRRLLDRRRRFRAHKRCIRLLRSFVPCPDRRRPQGDNHYGQNQSPRFHKLLMRCALRFKGDRFATPEEWRREDAPGRAPLGTKCQIYSAIAKLRRHLCRSVGSAVAP